MNNKKNIQKTKINKIPVYMVLFLVIAQIVVSLQTVAHGSELSILEGEREQIQSENKEFNAQIIESSSLTKLNQRSEELGFADPSKTLYLKTDEEVAILR
jgi:hypothetical protein